MGARRRFIAAAFAGCLAIYGAPAVAGVLGTWNLAVDPLTGLNFSTDTELNDPGQNWVAYNLGLSTDDGGVIQAVDVKLQGMFHQRWTYSDDIAGFAPSAAGYGPTSGDSHLMPIDAALFAIAPREDNNQFNDNSFGAPLGDTATYDYGVGSVMQSAWGFPRERQTGSIDLAHLVVPRGADFNEYQFDIEVATSTGHYVMHGCNFFSAGCGFASPPPPVLPEPPAPVVPVPPVVPQPPIGTQPTVPQPPVTPPALLDPAAPSMFAWATQLDSSTDLGLPFGYKAYKFGVSTTDGSAIAAVDFRLGSSVLQVFEDLDEDGIKDPTPRGLATTGADSHLLIPEGGLVMPLSEQLLTDQPIGNDPNVLMGIQMGGAWGLPNSMQSSSADLAYIVVQENANVQDLNLNVEVAARNGDTFFPVSYLKANDFNVLDANGNVVQAAIVDVPPIVEPPALPSDPPVIIVEEPGVENPEGIPVVIIDEPVEEPGETPGESPTEGEIDPPFNGEITILPIRPVIWDSIILRPAIDWIIYNPLIDIDVDSSAPLISYVDYFAASTGDSDYAPWRRLVLPQTNSFATNASFGGSLLSLTAYDAAHGTGTANAPEPSGVALAVLAILGVAAAARKRGS